MNEVMAPDFLIFVTSYHTGCLFQKTLSNLSEIWLLSSLSLHLLALPALTLMVLLKIVLRVFSCFSLLPEPLLDMVCKVLFSGDIRLL